jgi:hypothetical protein
LLTAASVGKVFRWQPLLPPDAIVDLSRATIDTLVLGGITYWPSEGQLWLGQLHYRVVNGPTLYKRAWLAGPSRELRARERNERPLSRPLRLLLRITDVFAGADATGLRWLRLSTRHAYNSQPYDALAAALRASGLPAEATRVLIASVDDRRRANGPLSVLAGLPYRLLVANGFRTWLAVVWLAAFVLVDTAVFTAANHAGHLSAVKPAAEHLPFQPFVYSLDLLLPIVDLGQANAFLPIDPSSGWLRAFWWLQICLGWILATAIAASAASALQRRQT